MRSALFALMFVGVIGAGCEGTREPAPPPVAPNPKPPLPPRLAELVAPPAPAPPPDANAFDPASIQPLLADARLAQVKASADASAWGAAATAMDTAVAAAANLSTDEKAAWLYELARLRALAGDHANATKAFRSCAEIASPLASFAHFSAAEELVNLSQYDAALAEIAAISGPDAMQMELDRIAGDALLGKGDVEAATKRFEAYMSRAKRPSQWVPIALRLAGALLGKPTEAHAKKAFLLARKVELEGTAGMGAGNAKEIAKQALASLPFAERKELTRSDPSSDLGDAMDLVASQQSKEALSITSRLVASKDAKDASDFSCELFRAHGDALANLKKKPEAAEAYQKAIDKCAPQSKGRVEAMFKAGKALASAGKNADAVKIFADLEREYPKHRLADDARLKGARAAKAGGDVSEFRKLLSNIDEDYPDGDMTDEGMFELALSRIEEGDWAGAIPTLEAGAHRTKDDRSYWGAGRFAYWLARAHIATGKSREGVDELERIVENDPLSFPMTLASARLAENDPEAFARAIREATAREPAGAFTVPRGDWASDPRFVAATMLAKVGDARALKLELDALGVGAHTAPSDLLYVAAFLYATAGDVRASHLVLRSSNNGASPSRNEAMDHLDHFPTGRWRAPWELMFPRPYLPIVEAEAKREGISTAFAYAIMREESAFDAAVASPAKAYGLMQLIVPTATKMGKTLNLPGDEDSLKKPEINVALGCRYLSVLRGEFPDNPLLAIPGYNAGSGAPKKWLKDHPSMDFDMWIEEIPYEETRVYTKRVLASLAAYEFLYGQGAASEALASPLAASPKMRVAAAAPPGPVSLEADAP